MDLRNIEGFDVEWMVYSYADKTGKSARFEISVLPLCAIVPCNKCWKCGLAQLRRQAKAHKPKI